MTEDQAPAWLPDPTGRHDHRYWDGRAWTDHVADGGVAGRDPYVAPVEEVGDAEEPGAPADAAAGPVADEPVEALTWRPGGRLPSPEPRPEARRPEPGSPDGPASDAPATGWASPATEPTAAPTPSSPSSSLPTPDEVVEALTQPAAPAAAPPVLRPGAGPEPEVAATDGDPAGPAERTAPVPDGGGRRRVLIGLAAVLVLVALAGAFLLLTEGDDDEERVAGELAGWIRDRGTSADDDDVDCLADAIVDEMGVEALDRADFDQPAPLAGEDGARLIAAYSEALSTCGLTDEFGTPDAQGSSDGGDADGDATGGDLSDPPTVEEQTEDYQEQYDLDEDEARCLAEADAEVRERAEAGEQLTTDELLAYVDDCGVDRSTLGLDQVDGSGSSTDAEP